jgi:diguanylate cyclase (GGDEF)-like protein/PAS domain S-box-containing protein
MATPLAAPIPLNEDARVAALDSYAILDTPSDPAYDAFATLAAGICETPIALVSLVDATRNWHKASVNFPGAREIPRELSLCTHAVASGALLEVADTLLDERFRDNPSVTGGPKIRFYAGAPLIDRDGHALGALCAIDRRPRELTAEQRESLGSLAGVVAKFIESRRGVAPRTLDHVSLLSGALESAPDPIVLLRIAEPGQLGTIVFANRAFIDLFGFGLGELLGNTFALLHGPNADLSRISRLKSAARSGEAGSEVIVLTTASGEDLTVEIRGRHIAAEYRIVSLRDLTRLHKAQAALSTANKRLEALYLISAARASNEAQQIDAALRLAADSFSMDSAYVGELRGEKLLITNGVGDVPLDIGQTVELEGTVAGLAIAQSDVITVENIGEPTTIPSGVRNYPGWGGYLVSPLVIEGTVSGVIGMIARRPIEFSDFDRRFMRLVSALVSTLQERRSQQLRLDRLAYYDQLTELPNRAKFVAALAAAVDDARVGEHPFALHCIDLDGFKAVNDAAGHSVGDLALEEVGRRLRELVRPCDLPARLGGDEFVLLQGEISRRSDTTALAGRIVAKLSEPYLLDGVTYALGASVGVAVFPDDGRDGKTLLHNADRALYAAKNAGKGRVEFTSGFALT